MKKIFLLILCTAMLLCSCNINPPPPQATDDTTDPPNIQFTSPEDEKEVSHHVSMTDDNGVNMEVTLHGYRSESQNKLFYVKNNEYIIANIKITNSSNKPIYQFLPTYCRESEIPHNHEIGFDIFCGEYALHSPYAEFVCTELIDIWTLEPGKTYEWTLKLAAGEVVYENYDLPADGFARDSGIKLYDKTLYPNGSCIFEGNFSFAYQTSGGINPNEYSITLPCAFEVIYIPDNGGS